MIKQYRPIYWRLIRALNLQLNRLKQFQIDAHGLIVLLFTIVSHAMPKTELAAIQNLVVASETVSELTNLLLLFILMYLLHYKHQ